VAASQLPKAKTEDKGLLQSWANVVEYV